MGERLVTALLPFIVGPILKRGRKRVHDPVGRISEKAPVDEGFPSTAGLLISLFQDALCAPVKLVGR
jgi:hypothetical protein